MTIDASAEAAFQEAQRIRPRWNEKAPDLDARRDRAQALFVQAAEAGHLGALRELADAGPEGFPFAVTLAKRGETNPLVSALTSGDHDVEVYRGVLAAARAGEPWAQLAVAGVYDLGMADARTGVLVATLPDGFGWLPAAADPEAEARVWVERARAAGWAPAHLFLAFADRFDAPDRALESLKAALASADDLTPEARARGRKLLPRLLDDLDAAWPERIAAWRVLADDDDGEALAWLGDRYRLGDGVEGDVAAARALYERAAAAADVDGCRELARMCEAGVAGPVDEDRARALYEQAAELGADAFSRDRLAGKYGLTWYARGPDER
jgi:TPR repeat protein